jgi:hypothetical protein
MIVVFAVVMWAGTAAFASMPRTLTYAGRLDLLGVPFTGEAAFDVELYREARGGEALWHQRLAKVAVVEGAFSFELGADAPLEEVLALEGPLFLAVRVDGEQLEPRTPLRAVPFALRAQHAEVCEALAGPLPAQSVGQEQLRGALLVYETSPGCGLPALSLARTCPRLPCPDGGLRRCSGVCVGRVAPLEDAQCENRAVGHLVPLEP